jgi:DNA invertase Pin-like site-specific DNA recombinase
VKRAAQYLRVSSDQQRHSLRIQAAEIADYAATHGYEIVQTYQDQGKSGLRLSGRAALQNLLQDVVTGAADFDAILVQDVSRWGRFQDADEAAHYEYLCREAGLEIHYCAEPFDAYPGRTGDIFKAMKRLMAAEFSRSLSHKTRASQLRWAAAGYKMGGVAGYGLRRALIDEHGQVKAILEAGQQRLLRTDRIVLVQGPPEEVATVRRIFRLFLGENRQMREIATLLNNEGIADEGGRAWSTWTIGNVLSSPKYAGDYVFGRRRRTLDGRRIDSPAEEVRRAKRVLPPIVPHAWIEAATRKRQKRLLFLPPAEIWRRLDAHVDRHRRLSIPMIEADTDLPSWNTCRRYYGPKNCIIARLNRHPPPDRSGKHGLVFLPGYIDSGVVRDDFGASYREIIRAMSMTPYTAFQGETLIASGDLGSVALAARAATLGEVPAMPLIFNDETGQVIDLDLRGTDQDVLRRLPDTNPMVPPQLEKSGRGRPRLGVIAREITLLPKHWDWLSGQSGGASAALRRLVEQAQRENAGADAIREAQTTAYRVMYALAGHLGGYEDALRALYAGDRGRFVELILAWPNDLSAYIMKLADRAL